MGCGSLRRGSEEGPGLDALGTRLAVRVFARLDWLGLVYRYQQRADTMRRMDACSGCPLWFPIFRAGLVAGLGDENGCIGGRDTRYWLSLKFLPLQIAPEALNDTEWEHCYYNFIEA